MAVVNSELAGMTHVMGALIGCRRALLEALMPLASRPGTRAVHEVTRLAEKPEMRSAEGSVITFDGCLYTAVSVDHESGASLCWSVTLYWVDAVWLVEPEISFSAPDEEGCSWPVVFPVLRATTSAELAAHTREAARLILAERQVLDLMYAHPK